MESYNFNSIFNNVSLINYHYFNLSGLYGYYNIKREEDNSFIVPNYFSTNLLLNNGELKDVRNVLIPVSIIESYQSNTRDNIMTLINGIISSQSSNINNIRTFNTKNRSFNIYFNTLYDKDMNFIFGVYKKIYKVGLLPALKRETVAFVSPYVLTSKDALIKKILNTLIPILSKNNIRVIIEDRKEFITISEKEERSYQDESVYISEFLADNVDNIL